MSHSLMPHIASMCNILYLNPENLNFQGAGYRCSCIIRIHHFHFHVFKFYFAKVQKKFHCKVFFFNTNYQIYSVIGQLIQTGTTAPDISTAQLGKGVYILRLENGKTFKFVK